MAELLNGSNNIIQVWKDSKFFEEMFNGFLIWKKQDNFSDIIQSKLEYNLEKLEQQLEGLRNNINRIDNFDFESFLRTYLEEYNIREYIKGDKKVTNKNFQEDLKKEYQSIYNKYSWQENILNDDIDIYIYNILDLFIALDDTVINLMPDEYSSSFELLPGKYIEILNSYIDININYIAWKEFSEIWHNLVFEVRFIKWNKEPLSKEIEKVIKKYEGKISVDKSIENIIGKLNIDLKTKKSLEFELENLLWNSFVEDEKVLLTFEITDFINLLNDLQNRISKVSTNLYLSSKRYIDDSLGFGLDSSVLETEEDKYLSWFILDLRQKNLYLNNLLENITITPIKNILENKESIIEKDIKDILDILWDDYSNLEYINFTWTCEYPIIDFLQDKYPNSFILEYNKQDLDSYILTDKNWLSNFIKYKIKEILLIADLYQYLNLIDYNIHEIGLNLLKIKTNNDKEYLIKLDVFNYDELF